MDGGKSAAALTLSEEQKQLKQRTPATRRGRIGKAENWKRERTKSTGNTLNLLVSGKRDRDSPEKSKTEKPAKKSATEQGDKEVKETGEKMTRENLYEGRSGRELLIELMEKVDRYEIGRRKDKEELKDEIKMEIKKEERKARKQQYKEMEQKTDERFNSLRHKIADKK